MANINVDVYTYLDGESYGHEIRSLYVGGTYTPRNYQPSHPSDSSLVSIYYGDYNGNYDLVTNSSVTIPSNGCWFDYCYESEGPEPQYWSLITNSWGTVTSKRQATYSIGEYVMRRISMTFSYSGTAYFYTTGNCDTLGFLGTSSSFDDTTGYPSSYLIWNDDDTTGKTSGYNFGFSYGVSANTTYYLWVRMLYEDDSGSPTVVVEPPSGTFLITLDHIYGNEVYPFYTESYNMRPNTVITFADYIRTDYPDYRYSYTTVEGSSTHITTATVTGEETYVLHYVNSQGTYTVTANCNGNCKQVSITSGGTTVTSPENGSVYMLVRSGQTVTVNYICYNGSSTTWYELEGWYSGGAGSGTFYSDNWSYTFTMPAENRTLYCYVIKRNSRYTWTYSGADANGNPISGSQKTQGQYVYLTALEWNRLWRYIQSVKRQGIAHTTAYQGEVLTAAMYNEAAEAIGISSVQQGQVLTAALLNNLPNSL